MCFPTVPQVMVDCSKECRNCKHYLEGKWCEYGEMYVYSGSCCQTRRFRIVHEELSSGDEVDFSGSVVIYVSIDKDKLCVVRLEPIYGFEPKEGIE